MFDFLIDFASSYGSGVSTIALGGLGALVKYEFQKQNKLIIDGSEDIKHERAVRTFESTFKTATRCLGYEIRRLQKDPEMQGRPQDVAFRFNAIWLNEWKEMLRSLNGATYKGRPLELYIHSTLNDWNEKKELLLRNLNHAMLNQPTPIENLEKYLSQFKHSLEYGSQQWLDKGLMHQEEPKEPVKKEPIFKKKVEPIELEVYEPNAPAT